MGGIDRYRRGAGTIIGNRLVQRNLSGHGTFCNDSVSRDLDRKDEGGRLDGTAKYAHLYSPSAAILSSSISA